MRALSKYLKRNDVILLSLIAASTLLAFVIQLVQLMNNGSTIVISVNGAEYGQYALEKDRTIPVIVDGRITNTVTIRDGRATMSEASCPDQLCVKQGAISGQSQSIVCLPNRVIVTVTDGEEPEIDTMTD